MTLEEVAAYYVAHGVKPVVERTVREAYEEFLNYKEKEKGVSKRTGEKIRLRVGRIGRRS